MHAQQGSPKLDATHIVLNVWYQFILHRFFKKGKYDILA